MKRALGWALVSISSFGCASRSPVMSPANRAPIVAQAEVATIVFLRVPSACDRGAWTTIVDERGAFLGDVSSGTHFVASVSPGDHRFYAWDMGFDAAPDRPTPVTGVMVAHVDAGRVYFVRVEAASAATAWRRTCVDTWGVDLFAMPRGRASAIEDLLAESEPYVADSARGTALLDAHRDAVARHIAGGTARLAHDPYEQRPDHVLDAQAAFAGPGPR